MIRTRTLIVALLTLAVTAIAVPAIQAAPTCTISWTGGAGTNAWATAGNWDLDRAPNGTDHVCLDLAGGDTVVITSAVSVQSVQGAQTLRLQSGSLSVADTGGEAILSRFEQAGGSLTGTGTLRVATSFDWTGGEQVSSGLLKVDGTTHIHPAGSVLLGVARRLETAAGSWTTGRIEAHNNVLWTVTGRFDLRSEDGYGDFVNQNNSTPPTIRVQPGAQLVKSTVTPSTPEDTSFDTDVEFAIDNDGLVRVEAGRLRFGNGSVGATGHFESTTGELVFYDGGSYGQVFQMEGATFAGLELAAGRLDVAVDKVFSGTDFHQSGGVLGGAGTLQTTGFEWTGGMMDGSGLTQDLGTAHIHPTSTAILSVVRRLETHDGAWTSGRIEGRNRAVWTVTGTFDMRPESGGAMDGDFVNHDNTARTKIHVVPGGELVKTATDPADPDAVTRTDFAIENDGTVETSAGRLEFHGGGGESTGDFASTGEGRTALANETFTVGDGGGYDGFELAGGRLDVTDGATYTGLDLWQTGGIIGGTGTLETTGTFTWTGGGMDGSGLTRSTGTTHIQPAVDVSLHIGRRLQTEDGALTGDGRMEVRNRALWTNTGTFDLRAERGDSTREIDYVNHDNTAWPVLHNTGTLVRTAGSGSTDAEIQIDNDGTTDASAGRLAFFLGGGESTGSFGSTGEGRTVLAAQTFTLGDGTFDGFEVAGGRVEVNPDRTYSGADLWQTGGTIGGAGTLVSTGTFDWTGGEMDQGGLTRSTGTTQIHPATQVVLGVTRRLETKHGSWTGDGRFEFRNRALWTNTGSFDIRAERSDTSREGDYVNHDNTALPVLHNTGTITRTSGSGISDLEIQLDNDGLVETSSGRLRFVLGGGESTGSLASTGDGRTELAAGDFTIGNGTFDGFEVSGGRVEVTAGSTYSGTDLWLSGGTIGGTGTLESSGAFDWTGGAMTEAGLTRSTGTAHIHPAAADTAILGVLRRLEVEDGSFTGDGRLETRNRAEWTIAGDFDLRAERSDTTSEIDYVNHDNTALPFIRNTGKVIRSAGDGSTDVDTAFENDGVVEVQAGRLRFTSGGGESAGAFLGTGGGRPVLAGGTFTTANSTFAGLEISGGRLDVNDGATLSGTDLFLSGGTLGGAGDVEITGTHDWTGGTMDGTGTTRSANVNAHPDNAIYLGRQRRWETGGGAWTSGRIEIHNRAHWESTGTFDLRTESGFLDYVNQDNTGVPTMHNAGTLIRTDGNPEAPPADLSMQVQMDNDGTISSQSGEISLDNGGYGTSTGTFGAILNGGSWTLGDGATFSGSAIVNANVNMLAGAVVNMPGGRLVNSIIEGDGDLLVPSGELRWQGGWVRGNGLFHVAKGAKLIAESNSHKAIAGRRLLQNEGEISWVQGSFHVEETATLLNEGTLDIAVEGQWLSATGNVSTIVNTGTLVKSAGTAEAYLGQVDNEGLLEVRSGTIYATGLRQLAGGRILVTLGGTERGTQHGAIDSVSSRGMAGTLAVQLAEGYTPADGDVFKIIHAGNDMTGFLTPETLTLPDGGSLTGSVDPADGMLGFTADVPAGGGGRRAQPVPVEVAPEPVPTTVSADPLAASDSVIRLMPGRTGSVAVPAGTTVQVITRTKRAKVRFDRKARKLRVKLRRGARGKRLKLRYRLVAADGRRSKVATLTVRIARKAPARKAARRER